MSARERNAVRYRMTEGLEYWGQRWALDGTTVRCVACHAGQLAEDAREPFVHVDGCAKTSEFAKYPWRELAELLRELPVVPQ